MSFITGVGLTAFGRHEGSSSLDPHEQGRRRLAIADAGLTQSRDRRRASAAIPPGRAAHIMLATVLSLSISAFARPYAPCRSGRRRATGLAMTMLAHQSDRGRRRQAMCWWCQARTGWTGQSADASILALAQVRASRL